MQGTVAEDNASSENGKCQDSPPQDENDEDIEEDHEVFQKVFTTVIPDEAVIKDSENGIMCKNW